MWYVHNLCCTFCGVLFPLEMLPICKFCYCKYKLLYIKFLRKKIEQNYFIVFCLESNRLAKIDTMDSIILNSTNLVLSFTTLKLYFTGFEKKVLRQLFSLCKYVPDNVALLP